MADRRRTSGSFEALRTTGSHEVLDRLFLYGTMRQSQTARSLLANSVMRSVPAWTAGRIYAFPMGYPGYTELEAAVASDRVVGEVVWLSELAATFGLIDAYEGDDFARVLKQVTLESGEQIWAWIYALSNPGAARHGTLIEDGDWVRWWTEHA